MRKSIEFFRNLPIVGWPEELHGYVRLWRGIIDVMVEDLINEPRTPEEIQNRASAEAWLLNKKMFDAQEPGFAQVCDNADLNPHRVRKIIDVLIEKSPHDR